MSPRGMPGPFLGHLQWRSWTSIDLSLSFWLLSRDVVFSCGFPGLLRILYLDSRLLSDGTCGAVVALFFLLSF